MIAVGPSKGACGIEAVVSTDPLRASVHSLNYSELSFKVMLPLKGRYRMAIDHQSYRLLHKSQRYDDDAVLEIQKMRREVAVQIMYEAFNGHYQIYVINFLLN